MYSESKWTNKSICSFTSTFLGFLKINKVVILFVAQQQIEAFYRFYPAQWRIVIRSEEDCFCVNHQKPISHSHLPFEAVLSRTLTVSVVSANAPKQYIYVHVAKPSSRCTKCGSSGAKEEIVCGCYRSENVSVCHFKGSYKLCMSLQCYCITNVNRSNCYLVNNVLLEALSNFWQHGWQQRLQRKQILFSCYDIFVLKMSVNDFSYRVGEGSTIWSICQPEIQNNGLNVA